MIILDKRPKSLSSYQVRLNICPWDRCFLQALWNFAKVRWQLYYKLFQDVRVPVQLQRAMAAEAEAAREARAKVVAAEGEQKASLHLKEAALVLEESTSALQLRYLQVQK